MCPWRPADVQGWAHALLAVPPHGISKHSRHRIGFFTRFQAPLDSRPDRLQHQRLSQVHLGDSQHRQDVVPVDLVSRAKASATLQVKTQEPKSEEQVPRQLL